MFGRTTPTLLNITLSSNTQIRVVRLACKSRRLLASNTDNNDSDNQQPPPLADIIQGPSLLRTPAYRPHPTYFQLPGLRSLPVWTSSPSSSSDNNNKNKRRIAYGDPMVTHVVNYLESHVDTIRNEYLQVAPGLASDYEATDHHGGGSNTGKNNNENNDDNSSLHSGTWKWHSYLNKGSVQGNFCLQFPKTAKILQQLRDDHYLFEGTPFGFCFFSTLHGGAAIQPHCSAMNLRLRIHLPLVVPTNNSNNDRNDDRPACGMRVANLLCEWKEGQALVLDDAYEHEVWNNHDNDQERVVLLVDIWHPDVSLVEKQAIVEMFQKARQDGLWKR